MIMPIRMTLEDVVNVLKPQYEIRTYGNLEIPIRSIRRLTEPDPMQRPDILAVSDTAEDRELLKEQWPCPLLLILSGEDDIPAGLTERVPALIALTGADMDEMLFFLLSLTMKGRGARAERGKMVGTLLHYHNIRQIVDTGCEYLGNALLLVDDNFSLLVAKRTPHTGGEAWETIEERGYMPPALVNSPWFSECMSASTGSPVPWQTDESIFGVPAVFRAVVSGGVVVAYLIALGFERALTEYDVETVELVSVFLQKELERYPRRRRNDLLVETIITGILENKNTEVDVDFMLRRQCGWNLKQHIYVMSISLSRASDAGMVSFQEIEEQLTTLVPMAKGFLYLNSLFLVLSSDVPVRAPEKEFKELTRLLKAKNMYAGLSDSFSNIRDVREYYAQSLKAIELGLETDGKRTIFRYRDYALRHLLSSVPVEEQLRRAVRPELLEITRAPGKTNQEHLNTLRVYLDEGKNLDRTAALLGVHRNTVKYRIAKMAELLQADLEDGETLFELQLSLKILDYLDEL